jgi:hypothetical protein
VARTPWLTVLAFAVLMAYADGFIVVALRGAVGSILRNDAPFATWLRESALVVPVYVAGVLAAVTWGQHRFGPRIRGGRATATTLAAIVGVGTVLGVLWTAASAAYDFRLQSAEMRAMPSMVSSCNAACMDRLDAAAAALQLRAVGAALVILLVLNLLVALWCHAMRGGYLVSDRARSLAAAPRASSRERDVQVVVGVALLGAAAVHAAVMPEHFAEWQAAGAFFLVLTAVEVVAAGLVLLRPQRVVLLLALAASIGPLLVWAYSRMIGLPFGPEAGQVEPVGLADVAADLLEVASAIGVVLLLRASSRLAAPGARASSRSLAVVGLVAVASLGLGGTGVSWLHSFGVDGGHGPTNETSVSAPSR